jgi:cysteine desulfurase
VLRAMNSSGDGARRSLRFSFGRFNSDSQIDRAIEIVPTVIEKLRQLSAPARESAPIRQEPAGITPDA